MTRKSSRDRLIEEAERFAAGCSRSRLELRLVDAIHRTQKEADALQVKFDNLKKYAEDCEAYGDVPELSDLMEFTRD